MCIDALNIAGHFMALINSKSACLEIFTQFKDIQNIGVGRIFNMGPGVSPPVGRFLKMCVSKWHFCTLNVIIRGRYRRLCVQSPAA